MYIMMSTIPSPVKLYLVVFVLFVVTHAGRTHGSGELAEIKQIDDNELMTLIKSKQYVLVLFVSGHCILCDKYETILTELRMDLREINGPIVKILDSQLKRLYSPGQEPILVFFRHGIPLLYQGAPKADLILDVILNNKEPAVKELTDNTFEPLTQAASGATTGDWFVMFYTPNCVDCHRLTARWEAVGARLKSRMNVARIDMAGEGSATAERFGVKSAPTFLFFRLGRYYRYDFETQDVDSFEAFARNAHRNASWKPVPAPKTPFDELVESVVVFLKDPSWIEALGIGAAVSVLFAIYAIFKYIRLKKPESKKAGKKKAKSK